jgi:hypothetical protein
MSRYSVQGEIDGAIKGKKTVDGVPKILPMIGCTLNESESEQWISPHSSNSLLQTDYSSIAEDSLEFY